MGGHDGVVFLRTPMTHNFVVAHTLEVRKMGAEGSYPNLLIDELLVCWDPVALLMLHSRSCSIEASP